MKKFQFLTLCGLLLIGSASWCNAEEVPSEKPSPEVVDGADDLYTGTDIVPLKKELSRDESMREDSSDMSLIDENDAFTELKCDNPKLKAQVEDFIYNNINKEQTNSVIEMRKRLLLVRNIKDFQQVSEDDIDSKTDFETLATLAYMKINKNIDIDKICRSTQNQATDFKDIYVILYVYAGYYKVVVTNLSPVTDKIDEATFIYNW